MGPFLSLVDGTRTPADWSRSPPLLTGRLNFLSYSEPNNGGVIFNIKSKTGLLIPKLIPTFFPLGCSPTAFEGNPGKESTAHEMYAQIFLKMKNRCHLQVFWQGTGEENSPLNNELA